MIDGEVWNDGVRLFFDFDLNSEQKRQILKIIHHGLKKYSNPENIVKEITKPFPELKEAISSLNKSIRSNTSIQSDNAKLTKKNHRTIVYLSLLMIICGIFQHDIRDQFNNIKSLIKETITQLLDLDDTDSPSKDEKPEPPQSV